MLVRNFLDQHHPVGITAFVAVDVGMAELSGGLEVAELWAHFLP
jgi:hypothetical protein